MANTNQELDKLIGRVRDELSDGETVVDFAEDLMSEGIGFPRIRSYLWKIIAIKRLDDSDFREWDKRKVRNVINHFVRRVNEGEISEHTLIEVKKTLKRFFNWYGKPELVDWFTLGTADSNISPDDLITQEDFEKMMDACQKSRDRAIISTLYEGGLRKGEISALKVSDVHFDDYGVVLWIPVQSRKSKIHKRKLRLVYSAKYLAKWLDDHPDRENKEAPLWVTLSNKSTGEELSPDRLYRQVKAIAKRAGINKRIYTHLFRHSRATKTLGKFSESISNKYMGWVPGSRMPQVYEHLTSEDVEEAVLVEHGIKKKDTNKDLEVVRCPRCDKINDGKARFCSNCGLVLDEKERLNTQSEEAKKMPELMNEIMANPQLRGKFKKMLQFVETMESDPETAKEFIEFYNNK